MQLNEAPWARGRLLPTHMINDINGRGLAQRLSHDWFAIRAGREVRGERGPRVRARVASNVFVFVLVFVHVIVFVPARSDSLPAPPLIRPCRQQCRPETSAATSPAAVVVEWCVASDGVRSTVVLRAVTLDGGVAW